MGQLDSELALVEAAFRPAAFYFSVRPREHRLAKILIHPLPSSSCLGLGKSAHGY